MKKCYYSFLHLYCDGVPSLTTEWWISELGIHIIRQDFIKDNKGWAKVLKGNNKVLQ